MLILIGTISSRDINRACKHTVIPSYCYDMKIGGSRVRLSWSTASTAYVLTLFKVMIHSSAVWSPQHWSYGHLLPKLRQRSLCQAQKKTDRTEIFENPHETSRLQSSRPPRSSGCRWVMETRITGDAFMLDRLGGNPTQKCITLTSTDPPSPQQTPLTDTVQPAENKWATLRSRQILRMHSK